MEDGDIGQHIGWAGQLVAEGKANWDTGLTGEGEPADALISDY